MFKAYARMKCTARGWGDDQFSALEKLWQRESSWNPKAENPSSGAYGIPQMNPSGGHAEVVNNPMYRNDYRFQIDTGLDYIAQRYGNPVAAWAHSEETGWY